MFEIKSDTGQFLACFVSDWQEWEMLMFFLLLTLIQPNGQFCILLLKCHLKTVNWGQSRNWSENNLHFQSREPGGVQALGGGSQLRPCTVAPTVSLPILYGSSFGSNSAQWGVPKPDWIVLSNIYNAPVLFHSHWNGMEGSQWGLSPIQVGTLGGRQTPNSKPAKQELNFSLVLV